MIEVQNLGKFYGQRQAVRNISFSVAKGDVMGFLGPNGAGKTTTMNMLCCIIPASHGSAKICGYDIFEQSLEIRKIIGYLPETPPLYPDMIVSDFLDFAARIRLVASKKIPAAVDRVVEKCGLKEVRHRIIGRLSKGFQQRVGLAQAMIHDPEILVLDEPTVGLDPIQIIEIRKLIKELASAHTIILSSHILPEVTQICNKVIILHEGEIAAMDSIEKLTLSSKKSERLHLQVRSASQDIVEQLSRLDKVISVHPDGESRFIIECELDSNRQDEVARMVLDRRWGLVELKTISMTLEDIFLKLTTEEQGVSL